MPSTGVGFVCDFFFFQAEDGIRDHCVTGVQTCALPIFRARQLDSHIRKEKPEGPSVRRTAVVYRDKKRAGFLIALPRCDDDARLLGPAAVVDELLDAVVFADVEVPGVAGGVTDIRGILHRDQLGRAVAQRQFLLALVLYIGAGVPVSMEGEQKPIVIVDETRIDFVLDGVGLAAKLRANVCSLYGLAVLILSFIGDLPGLGLPDPRTGDIRSGEL